MNLRAIPAGMDPAAVARIDALLDQVAATYGVHLPLCIESGSRAWGFPSPDSDYDCRFVYVRTTRQHLTPWPRRDVIEYPPDGDMDAKDRFYFRGPKGELNLPVQNLRIFMQMGDGVDDDTWTYHLRQGDYEHWFRNVLKDSALADHVHKLRKNGKLPADETRQQVFDYIRRTYAKQA